MSTSGIISNMAPRPVGHYPHARRVGSLLFLSGIGPRDTATNAVLGNVFDADGHLLSYDIALQTRSVLDNVQHMLTSYGADWSDVVDVTVFLTDMARDFHTYNAMWAEKFPDAASAPCRTTVGITALPAPVAIEFKCTAVLKED